MKKLTNKIALIMLVLLTVSFLACNTCNFSGGEEFRISLFPNGNEIAVTYNTIDDIVPYSACNSSFECTDYFDHDNRCFYISTHLGPGESDVPEKQQFKLKNTTGGEYYVVKVEFIRINGGEQLYLQDLPTKEYSCEQIIDSLKSQHPDRVMTITESEITIEGIGFDKEGINVVI